MVDTLKFHSCGSTKWQQDLPGAATSVKLFESRETATKLIWKYSWTQKSFERKMVIWFDFIPSTWSERQRPLGNTRQTLLPESSLETEWNCSIADQRENGPCFSAETVRQHAHHTPHKHIHTRSSSIFHKENDVYNLCFFFFETQVSLFAGFF